MQRFGRRDFLKFGLGLAGGAVASRAAPALALGQAPPRPEIDFDRVGDGNCQFCQVRCRLKVYVNRGRVVHVTGHPEDFWTGGSMCPKGLSLVELINSPERVLYPMQRVDGAWRRISYERALDLIVERLGRSKQDFPRAWGNRTVLFSPLWTSVECELASSLFMRAGGYPNILTPGETCISSASNTLALFLGSPNSTTTVDEVLNAETLVLWGANPVETLPPYAGWIEKARAKGVRVILLDCRVTNSSNLATRQLMPRPGSDGVLALGVIRHLLTTGQYDAGYVAAQVTGLESLKQAANDYTPEAVAQITRLAPGEVTDLADSLGQSRRTIVWLGGSLSRYTNGMQTLRSIIAIQGITNRLLGPGNGIITMEGGKPEGLKEFADQAVPGDIPEPQNMRRVQRTMEQGGVDVAFLNSSYRRYPDCNAVKAALSKVPLVVCRSFFMNEEAQLAQLLIPGAYGFESEGSQFGAERQVFWRDKIVEPPGEVVEDWRFYRDLGSRLAPDVYPGFESPRDLYRRFAAAVPSWRGLTLERLRGAHSGLIWPCQAQDEPERRGSLFREGRLPTPDGKLNLETSVLGTLAWSEPKGSPLAKEADPQYPLLFTQGKVVFHWQQSLTNYSRQLGQFCQGRVVYVHPETAKAGGIAEGEAVFIKTALGQLPAVARLTTGVLPGTLFTASHFSPLTPVEQNRAEPINTITPGYWDRASAQFNGFGCRLVKAG